MASQPFSELVTVPDTLLDPDMPGIAARTRARQAFQCAWDDLAQRVLLRTFLLRYPGTRALISLLRIRTSDESARGLGPAEVVALRVELSSTLGVHWARAAWNALLAAATPLTPRGALAMALTPRAFVVALTQAREALAEAHAHWASAPKPVDKDGCHALRVIEPLYGAVFVGHVRQRTEPGPVYGVTLDAVETSLRIRQFDARGVELDVSPEAAHTLVLGDLEDHAPR